LSGAGAAGIAGLVYKEMSDPSYPGRLKNVLPQSVKSPVKSDGWAELFFDAGMGPWMPWTSPSVVPQAAMTFSEKMMQWMAINSENVTQPAMTNPVLWGAISFLGTGILNLKMLYPRISIGVLSKVQSFIDVCESLKASTKDKDKSIVNVRFSGADELKKNLPIGWGSSNIAIYNALNNLAYQAESAIKLLNQIGGNDAEITEKRNLVDGYSNCLTYNKDKLEPIIDAEIIKQAKLANLQADTNLKETGYYALVGSMAKGAVSSLWNGVKELYAHPEILGVLGLGWFAKKYFTPSDAGAVDTKK
jgi:lipid-A-disaccharide synthase-like uncharacterized protein